MDPSPSLYVEDDSQSRLADRVGILIDGKYRVLRLIGHGSTGAVYACRHEGLDKLVALKVLHREMEANASFVERFKLEAQAASRLEHPNSVRVLDFGQDAAGSLYIAMEYVEGRDLLQVLEEDGPFPAERAVDIMSQILDVLGVAHSVGIVHRDLKPENILVRPVQIDGYTRELVTVCDFGIAQFGQHVRRASHPLGPSIGNDDGVVAGTPAYMSPEQARAQPQDARSDLYSAGVVLYQLLTLQLPFTADDALALAKKHCTEAPPRPSQFAAVNPALEAVCLKALAKSKDDRYQSAREMREALTRTLSASGEHGLLEATPTGIPRWGGPRVSLPQSLPAPPLGLSQGNQTPLATELGSISRSSAARKRLMAGTAAACLLLVGVAITTRQSRSSTRGHASEQHHLVQPSRALPTPASETTFASLPSSSEMISVAHAATDDERATQRSREADSALTAVEPARLNVVAQEGEPTAPTLPLATATPTAAPERSTKTKSASRRDSESKLRALVAAPSDMPAMAADRADKSEKPAVEKAAIAEKPELEVVPMAPPVPEKPSLRPSDFAVTVESMPNSARLNDALRANDEMAPPPRSDDARTGLPATAAKPVSDGATVKAPQRAAAVESGEAPIIDRARVTISVVEARSAVTKGAVRGALNMAAITDCYRLALREGAAPREPVTARIALTASMSGGITEATLDAPALPSTLRRCVEQVARRGRVRDADTGEAQANITLAFAPR